MHSSAHLAVSQSCVPACPWAAAELGRHRQSQAGAPASRRQSSITSSRKSSWCFSVEARECSTAALTMKSSFLGRGQSPWGCGCCSVHNYLKIRPEKKSRITWSIFYVIFGTVPLWTLVSAAGFRWMALLKLPWQPPQIHVCSGVQLTPASCSLSSPHTEAHSAAGAAWGHPSLSLSPSLQRSAGQMQGSSFYPLTS